MHEEPNIQNYGKPGTGPLLEPGMVFALEPMINIKSKEEIDAMREAGRISAKALQLTGAQVRPGISTLELDQICEEIIRLEGAVPAFKGYNGFPGSICASVNDAVVHGIPSAEIILQEGDIISIDTRAIING